MAIGDALRENSGLREFMGVLAAARIRRHVSTDQEAPGRGTIHVVDSLKRPEEVVYLSKVYGARFLLISIFSPREQRIENLKGSPMSEADAVMLVERDETGEDPMESTTSGSGQAVAKTFQHADFFLDGTKAAEEVKSDLRRFFDLIFGSPLVTPRRDEHAMFLAFAASLRSGDLSRQVGAVVMDTEGSVVADGANDAPRAFGKLYWPDPDEEDQRDIARGFDSNEKIKRGMLAKAEALLTKAAVNLEPNEVRAALKEAGFLDLTEFGRAVHAEMAALMSCARRGVSAANHQRFCTTFPCHNCTKHIVAAGVSEVVFIEPYPKSRAVQLHSDAVTMSREEGKIRYRPFVGIGPKRYVEFFALKNPFGESLTRKKGSEIVEWDRASATPVLPDQTVSYIDKEQEAHVLVLDLVGPD